MNNQNSLLASALRLIMAQRLVRKLCDNCKVPYEPSKEELLQIKTSLHDLDASRQPKYEGLKLFKAVGCPLCHNFGFKGRVAVVEQLENTPEMEALIGSSTTATTAGAIQLLATKQGMLTLAQNGVLIALSGQTTLAEVYSAIGD